MAVSFVNARLAGALVVCNAVEDLAQSGGHRPRGSVRGVDHGGVHPSGTACLVEEFRLLLHEIKSNNTVVCF
jgi:hypothetical protein